jgi:hypothetical protein
MVKPTIRTVTAFISFRPQDFVDGKKNKINDKVGKCSAVMRLMEEELRKKGYQVQTIRVATNPFGDWLLDTEVSNDESENRIIEVLGRLEKLDLVLKNHNIDFCSLGPATNIHESQLCRYIIAKSPRFSCSMNIEAGAVDDATIAAHIILEISALGNEPNAPGFLRDGQGNFRFCAVSNCKPYIPFFPAAKSDAAQRTEISFAIGLENGLVAGNILRDTKTIGNIHDHFGKKVAKQLLPIQELCRIIASQNSVTFLGIDSSLNPSLEEKGSIASAIEHLDEVKVFGSPGTVAAAAQITRALQSLEGIKLIGYCGLMLPVCEDTRLAELASETKGRRLRVSDLLSVSSVCGVGIDTVPLPGDASVEDISSLILDMAGVAGRWNKSLSARLFPIPGKKSGDMTTFDSPFLINARVFSIE